MAALIPKGTRLASSGVQYRPRGAFYAPQGTRRFPNTVPYNSDAVAIFTAMAEAGASPSFQRRYTINRCVQRMQDTGVWSLIQALYFIGDTEAVWRINWKSPGTNNLTVVGSPTFTANVGVTTGSVSNYYDTGIALNSLAQNNTHMSVYASAGNGSVAQLDMGAQDSSANGLTINLKNASAVMQCRGMGVNVSFGSSGQWGVPYVGLINRTAGTTLKAYRHGLLGNTSASSSQVITESPTISILFSKGGTTFSARTLSAASIGSGLTDAQAADMCAIIRCTADSIIEGEPQIYDAGTGPTTVDADIVVYGASAAGACAAYQAVREGHTALIVGAWGEDTVTKIGGMPVNGIGWIDTKFPNAISGLFRTMITMANTEFGSADTQDQAGMSIEPRYWNYMVRKMLDPARTTGVLPGKNIPLYFSNGLASVQKTGTTINSITTVDGLVATGRMFVGADYDGEILPLAGIPYILGAEPTGTAPGETLNGFLGSTGISSVNNGATNLFVDPYVNPGVSSSGLIDDLIAMPSIPIGAADPTLQSMNFRITVSTSNNSRKGPMTGGYTLTAPAGYDPARYERLARLLAADTAISHVFPLSSFITTNTPLNGQAGIQDVNNSSCGVSTDLPQSGTFYLQTTTIAQRRQVMLDIRAYMQGLFYWILQSGDPRIQSGFLAAFQAYGIEPQTHLDPGTGNPLFWPAFAYRRTPIWQMVNTFAFSAHDTFVTNGTTPRSTSTISTEQYSADCHAPRSVAYNNGSGTQIFVEGGYLSTSPGGTDHFSPVPLEAFVPDAAVCTNFMSPIYPAMTKVAMSSFRMEGTMCLAGQGLAIAACQAIEDASTIQAVNYAAVRTRFLAVPDAVAPNIPQVN